MLYILMNVWGYENGQNKSNFFHSHTFLGQFFFFFFLSSVHSQDTTGENLQIYRK